MLFKRAVGTSKKLNCLIHETDYDDDDTEGTNGKDVPFDDAVFPIKWFVPAEPDCITLVDQTRAVLH
jgi:hypothetical protein